MRMTKEDCIYALKEKYVVLNRYPCKSDFTEDEVAMIKSYLGPWPRALEAAGIKEPKEETRAQRRKQKRIETKRARNAERKKLKKQNVAEKKGKETE